MIYTTLFILFLSKTHDVGTYLKNQNNNRALERCKKCSNQIKIKKPNLNIY